MKCIICGNDIKTEQTTCSKCRTSTIWSQEGKNIFKFKSEDILLLKKAQRNYQNKIDQQKKQAAARKAEQERIREQNRIDEEQRKADLRRAEDAKKAERNRIATEERQRTEIPKTKKQRSKEGKAGRVIRCFALILLLFVLAYYLRTIFYNYSNAGDNYKYSFIASMVISGICFLFNIVMVSVVDFRNIYERLLFLFISLEIALITGHLASSFVIYIPVMYKILSVIALLAVYIIVEFLIMVIGCFFEE